MRIERCLSFCVRTSPRVKSTLLVSILVIRDAFKKTGVCLVLMVEELETSVYYKLYFQFNLEDVLFDI